MSEYNKNTEEIPAPKAVEGYEPPRPIETIEGWHDRELKELQARVALLEVGINVLLQKLEEHTHREYDGSAELS